MSHSKKIFGFIAAIGLVLTLASCGSSSTTNAISANAASWTKSDLTEFENGCLNSEDSPTKAVCKCVTSELTNAYSKTDWKIAVDEMNKSGIATQVYMDSWTICENKFGSVGSGSAPDGPTESQQKQANYPTCVQVLAPGNSGLSLADNDTELGRPDGQPGYCILPNSGGEKYYYQGRR